MPDPISVSADVMADYTAVVTNGVKPSDRAKQRNVTPSTISAGVKRVRTQLDNGGVVNVDGSPSTSATPNTPATVDPIAVAIEMGGMGGKLIADELLKHDAERTRIDAERERLDTATTALDASDESLNALAERVEFDIDAWRAALAAPATPAPATVPPVNA